MLIARNSQSLSQFPWPGTEVLQGRLVPPQFHLGNTGLWQDGPQQDEANIAVLFRQHIE